MILVFLPYNDRFEVSGIEKPPAKILSSHFLLFLPHLKFLEILPKYFRTWDSFSKFYSQWVKSAAYAVAGEHKFSAAELWKMSAVKTKYYLINIYSAYVECRNIKIMSAIITPINAKSMNLIKLPR